MGLLQLSAGTARVDFASWRKILRLAPTKHQDQHFQLFAILQI